MENQRYKRKIKDTKMENQSEQNGRAIPEITTEITSRYYRRYRSPPPKGKIIHLIRK